MKKVIALQIIALVFLCMLPKVCRSQTQVISSPLGCTLANYAFLASSTTATLSGYFIDINGLELSAPSSISITSGTAEGFANFSGGIPAGAVGFVGQITGGSIEYTRGGWTNSTTPVYTPTSSCPVSVVSSNVSYGRVFQ